MTKIQLRRDTAANWSTNNPTLSAGEPCFETDTGKLKIGDGITAYNSLPYQGGTSDTTVTTDTDQTISGKKTFANDIVINQWNHNISPVREAHIDLSNGSGNIFISTNGTDKTFGMYTKSSEGIQLCADALDYTKGLSIKPSSLTFKNSDGTVIDLLAGGGGDIPVATSTTLGGVKIGTVASTKLSLDEENKIRLDSSATLNNPLLSETVTTKKLYLGHLPADSYNPAISYDEENYVCNMLMKARQSHNGFVSYGLVDTIIKGKSLQFGDETNQYDVITKSPVNNEYMSHMAMPSNKYIDLELGASGTTYTAPADGYFCATTYSNNEDGFHSIDLFYNQAVDYTKPFIRWQIASQEAYGGGLALVKKGQNVCIGYSRINLLKSQLKFIYAVGSEPAS
jgi:hypothetical protein